MPLSGIWLLCVTTAAALAGAAAGLLLTGARTARAFVPAAGGLLLGVAAFGLLPELAREIGAVAGVALFAGGYLALRFIDKRVYPVCPSCSHDHDHDACAAALHGFAAPLVAATALHAFLDGWSVAAAQSSPELRVAVPLAVTLHKVPEGIALGAILRAALRSRSAAMLWSALAESATLAGGAVALAIAPHLAGRWLHYPLAVAGGCFLYLGFHAIHGDWRRRGPRRAGLPALAGLASAAVLYVAVR
ncbi:MAG: ZIP family metal transporter [Bryobacteraceae bacterium]